MQKVSASISFFHMQYYRILSWLRKNLNVFQNVRQSIFQDFQQFVLSKEVGKRSYAEKRLRGYIFDNTRQNLKEVHSLVLGNTFCNNWSMEPKFGSGKINEKWKNENYKFFSVVMVTNDVKNFLNFYKITLVSNTFSINNL